MARHATNGFWALATAAVLATGSSSLVIASTIPAVPDAPSVGILGTTSSGPRHSAPVASATRKGLRLVAAVLGPAIRPIIFIPGIEGSFLDDTAGSETWPQAQNIANCVETLLGIPYGVSQSCVEGVLDINAFTADGKPPTGSTVDVANGVENPLDSGPGGAAAAIGGVLTYVSGYVSIFPASTAHYYDVTAQNAADSGYTVVQSDSAAGLSVCSGNPQCFVPVGVDWRLSAEDNAARVLAIIQQVLTITGSDRVDILAHSQGGLIASALVHTPASVGDIYRIVTLGTPYLGAAEAWSELLYAQPCLDPHYFGCPLDTGVVQSLIENFPGAAELDPSAADFAASPQSPMYYSGGDLTYAQAEAVEAAAMGGLTAPAMPQNMNLVDAAAAFHAATDHWAPLDPEIGLLRMVGYDGGGGSGCSPSEIPCTAAEVGSYNNDATIVSVDAEADTSYVNQHLPPQSFGTGDGTVPLYSASVYDPATNFDDRGLGHNMYWCGISHEGLAQSTAVWQQAEAYLEGAPNPTRDSAGNDCPDGTYGSIASLGLIGATSNSATVLTAAPNPGLGGHSVTFTATISPSTATGNVTFSDASTTLGSSAISGGAASLTTSMLTVGNHSITAAYIGDGDDNASGSAPVMEEIDQPPGAYTAVTPFRVCDTRPAGSGITANQCDDDSTGAGIGPILKGATRVVTVDGFGGLPATGVAAVVVNTTAIAPTSGTYLALYPDGGLRPSTSNLNPQAGKVVANLVEVAVSPSGKIDVFNALGSINIVLDIEGYVSASSIELFTPVAPTRVCDTRAPVGGVLTTQCNSSGARPIVATGPVLTFNVHTATDGIPSTGVSAVVFNLTAIAPSAPTVLTAYAGGSTRPTASNINLNPGQAVPNRVIVPVSASGTVSIWNGVGSVNVAVDVNGWFGPSSGAEFSALVPIRVCDTQGASVSCAEGLVGARHTLNVSVAGVRGIPQMGGANSPIAVVANVTAVNASTGTLVTAYPGPPGSAVPSSSDLNIPSFEPVTNLLVVEVGPDGTINLRNAVGNVNLIVDILGYYSG